MKRRGSRSASASAHRQALGHSRINYQSESSDLAFRFPTMTRPETGRGGEEWWPLRREGGETDLPPRGGDVRQDRGGRCPATCPIVRDVVGHSATKCGRSCAASRPTRRSRFFAPPSGLPPISPTRGEIKLAAAGAHPAAPIKQDTQPSSAQCTMQTWKNSNSGHCRASRDTASRPTALESASAHGKGIDFMWTSLPVGTTRWQELRSTRALSTSVIACGPSPVRDPGSLRMEASRQAQALA